MSTVTTRTARLMAECPLDCYEGPTDSVLLAGDWHANAPWARAVISAMPKMPGPPKLILHVGDFGYWPNIVPGQRYLNEVDRALASVGASLYFLDGNHEDHDSLAVHFTDRAADVRRSTCRQITDRIWWMPRGYRWTWHGKQWLALGGATSVDRPALTEGEDWFAQEALSAADVLTTTDLGQCDVMLTHDCPDGVDLRLPAPERWWDLGPAQRHRENLRAVVDRTRPGLLVHGHYHIHHDTSVVLPPSRRKMRVIGLNCDGGNINDGGNTALLDTHLLHVSNPWSREEARR